MSETKTLSQIITDEIKQHLSSEGTVQPPKPQHFRKAVFRGLGVLLPPLLTVVIFFWIGGTVADYVIKPFYYGTRSIIVYASADIVLEKELPQSQRQEVAFHKKGEYQRIPDATYVPTYVWNTVVKKSSPKFPVPRTGLEIYQRYVEIRYLNPAIFLPVSIIVFTLLLYLIGKFIAAEIGRFFWHRFEKIVKRVPLVSNVYGAVKQVSDFILAERTVQFSRVVAVQWPRQGMWSLAFVTSEGLYDIEKAAGEPLYAVLIPTSPMPMTEFTMHVKRSETIELSITLDQALQVIVSCGVVVPPRRNNVVPEVLNVVQQAIQDVTSPLPAGEGCRSTEGAQM